MLKRLVFFGLVLALSITAAAETVVMRADYWYPFNGHPNSIRPGFMVEIARRAFAKANITVDYRLMSWQGALQNAYDGNIDCVFGASKIQGRGLLYPRHSFGVTDTGFYARAGEIPAFSYKGLASIRQFRLGVAEAAIHIQDPAVIDYIKKYQATDKVYLSDDNNPLRDLMAKLLTNEIDLIVETPAVFHAIAQEQRLSILFEEVSVVGKPEPVYIACSKRNPRSPYYLDLLDKELMLMRKTGELEKLLQRYKLFDWQ